MRPDRMAAHRNFLEHVRVRHCHASDNEKGRLGAVGVQCSEHGRRMPARRSIVEGQYNLVVLEKAVVLSVLELRKPSFSRYWRPPKRGPKVVSISTIRETPMAFEFGEHLAGSDRAELPGQRHNNKAASPTAAVKRIRNLS